MIITNRIGLLMFRYIRHELTTRQKKELDAWRQLSPDNETSFRRQTNMENIRADYAEMSAIKESVYEKLKQDFPQLTGPGKRRWRPDFILFGKAAAIVILAIRIIFFISLNYRPEGNTSKISGEAIGTADVYMRGREEGENDIWIEAMPSLDWDSHPPDTADAALKKIYDLTNFIGHRFFIHLPDHSEIVLNERSEIMYARNFSAHSIPIELIKGEAWFRLARGSGKHFVFTAGPIEITPLSGIMDIQNKHTGSEIIVTSLRDSALVRIKGGLEPGQIILKAGQQIKLNTKALSLPYPADTLDIYKWRFK